MEEINLKELFDYIKERILIVIIILLSVLVLGCVYSIFLKTPIYRSNATIVLVSDDGSAGGASGNGYTQSDVNLNRNLVATYSDILKSRRVLENVIDDLELDYSYNKLYSSVSVSTSKDTEILKIVVADPDKTTAADIANQIVKVFGEEIKSIYKLQNVSVVDKAVEADEAYNINIIKDLIIYIMLGLVLGLGSVFIIYYFDTTIKSAEMVENKLGLPIFGIVPRIKRRSSKK